MATAATERASNVDAATNGWYLFAFDDQGEVRKNESGLLFKQGDGEATARQGRDLLTNVGSTVEVRGGNHKVVVQAAYCSIEGAANQTAHAFGFNGTAIAEADKKNVQRWFDGILSGAGLDINRRAGGQVDQVSLSAGALKVGDGQFAVFEYFLGAGSKQSAAVGAQASVSENRQDHKNAGLGVAAVVGHAMAAEQVRFALVEGWCRKIAQRLGQSGHVDFHAKTGGAEVVMGRTAMGTKHRISSFFLFFD